MNESLNAIRLEENHVSRRTMLGFLTGVTLGAALQWESLIAKAGLKGRITQSVCLWCYNSFRERTNTSLESFAASCAKMGLKSIEITGPETWPTLKEHGLICAMTPSHGISKGINHVENHEECLGKIRQAIDDSADAGFPNVITFSGNRDGMDDEEGLKNSVKALKKIAGYAEQKKVTVCLELLNSINHKDYMADSTRWCVELVKQVGSPRVKVLYDIYHAAMMKEDVLADIQNLNEYWGHYHTGGYPGRNEIDETQTLDYEELMKAIVATGYKGWVGQEFVPKREDALNSLQQAISICDV